MRPRSPQRNRGKGEKTNLSAATRLDALIEEALVDTENGDSEQRTAFFTIMENSLALPFLRRSLAWRCPSSASISPPTS